MEIENINKAIKEFIGIVEYDEYAGGYIWGKNQKNSKSQMIAEIPEIREGEAVLSIRGWGAIQNMKNLPCSPEEFQNAIGRFITEAINEKLNKLP